MYLAIFGKLVSESMLSLYPTIVKNIRIPFGMQLWTRFITYALVSAFFVDWTFIGETLGTGMGILLSVITMIHVYVSYRGFQLLDGGVAYAIFYTYPFMILLLGREKIRPTMFIALLGIILLTVSNLGEFSKKIAHELTHPFAPIESASRHIHESFEAKVAAEKTGVSIEGIAMVLLAALTEAFIYFIVKRIKTLNNWNHLFLSYILGAVCLSFAYLGNIANLDLMGGVGIALGANVFIGLFGYLLRFYAISRLKTTVYAPLSYFGIFMAFVYGISFGGETVSWQKVAGALCIVFANWWSLYSG